MARRKGKGGQGKVSATRDQIRSEFLALDDDELLAYVARHFCQGYPPAQIADLLKNADDAKWLRDPHHDVSREKITRLVLYAASRGWIHFQRPHDSELGEEIRRRFDLFASHVRVVASDSIDDIARHAAEALLQMARTPAHRKVESECHIGWGGGALARRCARFLGQKVLHSPEGVLARKYSNLYMHALVSGFSVEEKGHFGAVDDPTSEPGSFFSYLAQDPGVREIVRCIGFHAPGLLRLAEYDYLKTNWPIDMQRAFAQKKSIDIIIASPGHWDCSRLHAAYQLADREHLKELKSQGYFGDILWQEISRTEPLRSKEEEESRKIRAMTLFSLAEVKERIDNNSLRVLLVVGRCPDPDCNRPHGSRTEALRRALQLGLATDLVCDSRTAVELLDLNHERESETDT